MSTSERRTQTLGPMTFDCDTLADRNSAWSLAIRGPFRLRGWMRFHSELEHPQWLPAGTVVLGGERDDVFLSAFRPPGAPDHLDVSVRFPEDGETRVETLGRMPFSRERIPFEVRSEGHTVVVKLGLFGARHRHHVETLGLRCNTANVVFENVELELQRPE